MNKNLTSNEIRAMFLEYFREHGHMIEPGASLIPVDDPTLLWINAGVAALKKYLDGREKPACNRIANAQKCIRTNDIENVGKTARHHTFFEMLGNWSIGDYFKEESLKMSWEFLTSPKWIGFDPDRLYVTIYPDDTEAYRIWTEVCGINPKHILKSFDNYWEIGEGPCGPDSEIYYDRGPEFDPQGIGEKLFFEEMENDRYVEIWNNVFSQYNSVEGVDRKDYKELPQKNIDTGMGLERLTCLVQGGETNFDTDLFLPIIHATEAMAVKKYSEREYKMAYRVIADHIRTVTFALADGANFSNEGRGYVLRRVLRRAVRYGIKIGIQGAFMYKLVQVVADNMKDFYPYLEEKVDLISKLVKNEEEAFHATLANGEKLLKDVMAKNANTKVIDGATVFKLYDTYGFPKELTLEIAEDDGFTVDMQGFEREMALQKERARNARSDEQSMSAQSIDLMNFTTGSEFTGYTDHICTSKVIGLFKDGVAVDEITDYGEIIVDKTCFYAESGGQVADTGIFECENCMLKVTDVKKAPHKQPLHHVEVLTGSVKMGDVLNGAIDISKRFLTMANHSALHLLDSALRLHLGTHVAQAGSYVCSEYGRFDFTHFEKVTEEQLLAIEKTVNEWISAGYPVDTAVLAIEDAKKTGAIALFDEKYGDTVRVVSMGDVSKEFCGGTHVSNTSEIGVFKIVSEESIGSGTRRITVKTKLEAYHDFKTRETRLNDIAKLMKQKSTLNLEDKITAMIEENAKLKKEIARQNEQMLMFKADETAAHAKKIDDLSVLVEKCDIDAGALKNYAEALRNKMENGFVFLASVNNDKVVYVCTASKAAIAKGYKAGDLVKEAAIMSGGNGGGRPDMAQAGGKDVSKVAEVLKMIDEKIK